MYNFNHNQYKNISLYETSVFYRIRPKYIYTPLTNESFDGYFHLTTVLLDNEPFFGFRRV